MGNNVVLSNLCQFALIGETVTCRSFVTSDSIRGPDAGFCFAGMTGERRGRGTSGFASRTPCPLQRGEQITKLAPTRLSSF